MPIADDVVCAKRSAWIRFTDCQQEGEYHMNGRKVWLAINGAYRGKRGGWRPVQVRGSAARQRSAPRSHTRPAAFERHERPLHSPTHGAPYCFVATPTDDSERETPGFFMASSTFD